LYSLKNVNNRQLQLNTGSLTTKNSVDKYSHINYNQLQIIVTNLNKPSKERFKIYKSLPMNRNNRPIQRKEYTSQSYNDYQTR